ncbi:MAG: hypothetical protein IPP06_15865 [Saprospiraceae bacterium]|nr:hypothetical protein [Candidatus Vicinibacter affinis]
MKDLFSKARQFLSNAKIGDTLDILESFLHDNDVKLFAAELISIRARYARNKQKEIQDLETSDKVNQEWNKLTYAILELLNEIEREVRIEVKRCELQKSYQDVAANNNTNSMNPNTPEEWNSVRNSIYSDAKDICLVHTLWPSKRENQDYDIYIYLIKHKSNSLEEVEYAEFFLGKYWKNKVFKVDNKDNRIGIYTSAYGPFLCLCKIKFKSGEEAFISRYIDFEQGELVNTE